MNKSAISLAIGKCHTMIINGKKVGNMQMVNTGAFGLEIINTMLGEPEQADETTVIVLMSDVSLKERANIDQPEHAQHTCPRCGNSEIRAGAKFCKICGLPLFAAKQD